MTALAWMGDAAEGLARLVGLALLHGTALAAVAWLLSVTLLRRARPAVLAALWTVALVKFALPVGPAMPWSLSNIIDALLALGRDAPASAPVVAPARAVAAASGSIGLVGLAAIAGVAAWAAAVAIIAIRRVRGQQAAIARAIALPAAPGDVDAIVRDVAARLGLAHLPVLRVDPIGGTPWVAGIRRPVVVVPAALIAHRRELTAALAHELGHLRRRDAWLRLAQVAIGALFFFWPVVRWVNRRIDTAREMACDAYAVAHGPLPAPEYARLLLHTVRGRAPAGALGLAATPRLLRGRVDALLGARPGTAPGIGRIGALGLAVWTAIALGGAAQARADRAGGEVCVFTPAMASSILAAHPEADADGDGNLTRAEACEFQLELRRRIVDEVAPGGDPGPVLAAATPLANEPLCCNCGDGEGTSSPPSGFVFRASEPANTCVRGVNP